MIDSVEYRAAAGECGSVDFVGMGDLFVDLPSIIERLFPRNLEVTGNV
jgi:hypothetical protein